MADLEFSKIRDATKAELRQALNDASEALPEADAQVVDNAPSAGSELNALTFLKIATHFSKDFEFEPYKADSLEDDI